MMRRVFGVGVMASLVLLGVARADSTYIDPTGPNPTLPAEPVTIIDDNGQRHVFTIEVASTTAEQDTGLMFRTSIAANGGMIFPWAKPQMADMWMENCPVPEDMVFIGADGIIKKIAENTVPYSTADISSGVPVAATLELQGGITAAENISVGDRVIAKQFGGG
jgi:uncharacterized membrane protein (UPF0127 family)